PERVVRVDAHRELHAALEVEPELELLGLERAGDGPVIPLGEHRVHADGRKHREHRGDGEDFPAKVLVHGQLCVATTVASPCRAPIAARATSMRTLSAIWICTVFSLNFVTCP